MIDLYAIGGIEVNDLTGRIEEISKKIDMLQNDAPVMPELTIEEAKAILADAGAIFDGDDMDMKRAFVSSLISKIVLTGNNIEIHWRFS